MRRTTKDRTASFRKPAFLNPTLWTLWFAAPLFAAAAPDHKKPDSIKSETELRLRLTQRGFEHLFKLWSGRAEFYQRIDMYFDTHEHEQFLLRRLEPRAKLRLQDRGRECVAQKSWLEEQHVTPSEGFLWTASTRSAADTKHTNESETCRRQLTTANFISQAAAVGKINAHDIAVLEQVWAKQSWPKLFAFDSSTAHLQGPTVPAAFVKKQRWSIKFTSSSYKPVKIQLGRDTDLLGSGQPENYELEVETKDSSVSAEQETLHELSAYLARSGLSPADTNPQNSYDFFKRLENLYANGR